MYLILDDGTNVCGTVDELIEFLSKYQKPMSNVYVKEQQHFPTCITTKGKPIQNPTITICKKDPFAHTTNEGIDL